MSDSEEENQAYNMDGNESDNSTTDQISRDKNEPFLTEQEYVSEDKIQRLCSSDNVPKYEKDKLKKYAKFADKEYSDVFNVVYPSPSIPSKVTDPPEILNLLSFAPDIAGHLVNPLTKLCTLTNWKMIAMLKMFGEKYDTTSLKEIIRGDDIRENDDYLPFQDYFKYPYMVKKQNVSTKLTKLSNTLYDDYLKNYITTNNVIIDKDDVDYCSGQVLDNIYYIVFLHVVKELNEKIEDSNLSIHSVNNGRFLLSKYENNTVKNVEITDDDLLYFNKTISEYLGVDKVQLISESLRTNIRDKKEQSEEKKESDLEDKDVAKIVLDQHSNEVFKFNGLIYVYYHHIWITDTKLVFRQWLSECESDVSPEPKQKRGKKGTKPKTVVKNSLVCNLTKKWPLYITQIECLCERLPNDNEKGAKLNNIKDILPFENGYWNFLTSSFHKYDQDSYKFYFTFKLARNIIESNNQERMDAIRAIFLDMVGSKEVLDELMTFWCRALAGYVVDKLFLTITGERNSGKGVINMAFVKSFTGTIGNIDANEFIAKKSMESSERRKGFLLDLTKCLICFSQEVNSDQPLDGTLLKVVSSGGDTISARESYGRLEKRPIIGSYTLMCQNVPEIKPTDAMETMLSFNMPNKYVRSESDFIPNTGFTYKIANDDIKNMFNEVENQEAFIMFVFSYFKKERPKYTILRGNTITDDLDAGNQGNETEKVLEIFRQNFIVTGNENDTILTSEVLNTLKTKECMSFNSRKCMKFIIAQPGCTYVAAKSKPGVRNPFYTGIKKIED